MLALLPWLALDSKRQRLLTASQIVAFLGYFVALALGADQHSAYAILNALLAGHLGLVLWQVGRLSSPGLGRGPAAAPEAGSSTTSAAHPS